MEQDIFKTFAEKLRELIESENISVNEFSKRIGIPQQTLSRYLLCQREVTLVNLCKIADYFHEDIDFLLGRKEY